MNQPTTLSLSPGDTLLGRYQLDHVIGEGGMGTVWRAIDLTLEHPVAIKVLPAALSRDKRAVARLKAEARRNLELSHAHIVRLHTFEQDPGRANAAFLVMQYVEGQTLNDLLAEHPDGRLEILEWFAHAGDLRLRPLSPRRRKAAAKEPAL